MTIARPALLACVLCSCASYSTRYGATPLPANESELTVAVDALVFERGRRYQVVPLPEVAWRRGMREGWDLGGRIALTSTEVSARFALASTAGWALAWGPSFGVGYEPVTNNSTDLIYARAGGRLLFEAKTDDGFTAVLGAYPTLTFTGPLTMLQGVGNDPRWILRPGLVAATSMPVGRRRLWFELTVQPPYVLGESWREPELQTGAAISF